MSTEDLVVVGASVFAVLVVWFYSSRETQEHEDRQVTSQADNVINIRIESINFYNGTPEKTELRPSSATPQSEGEFETNTEPGVSLSGDAAPASADTTPQEFYEVDTSTTILDPTTPTEIVARHPNPFLAFLWSYVQNAPLISNLLVS